MNNPINDGGPAFPCETYGLRNGKETTIPPWLMGGNKMTQEQKQIAIAEACGWNIIEVINGVPFGILDSRIDTSPRIIPDYLNDLNAMHEAEKMLTPLQWFDYSALLTKIVGPKDQEYYLNLHATAAQRAETFGLTLKLW